MKITITELADTQIESAYGYYRDVGIKVGHDFRVELEKAINAILAVPCGFPVIYSNHRRKLLRNFPYGIFYFIHNEEIFISALFHQAQDPDKITKVLN